MGVEVRDTCKGMSFKFSPHFSYSRNTHVCFLLVVYHVIKNSCVQIAQIFSILLGEVLSVS